MHTGVEPCGGAQVQLRRPHSLLLLSVGVRVLIVTQQLHRCSAASQQLPLHWPRPHDYLSTTARRCPSLPPASLLPASTAAEPAARGYWCAGLSAAGICPCRLFIRDGGGAAPANSSARHTPGPSPPPSSSSPPLPPIPCRPNRPTTSTKSCTILPTPPEPSTTCVCVVSTFEHPSQFASSSCCPSAVPYAH